MLATHPDIYAAQRHRVQAVEPPSWDIIAPPFTRRSLRYGAWARMQSFTVFYCIADASIPTE